MTLLEPPTVAPERDRSKNRKVKAILAGGLVLGLGAAVTLAAWNDSEYAAGTFTVGSFVFQGASVEGVYADHAAVDDAATLDFQLDSLAANLTPGAVVSAPFSVKLTGTSSADVVLTGVTADVGQGLTYSVVETADFGCDIGTAVITAAALGTGSAAVGTMAPDDELFFCFTVTASSAQEGSTAIVQGETTNAVWRFAATSID